MRRALSLLVLLVGCDADLPEDTSPMVVIPTTRADAQLPGSGLPTQADADPPPAEDPDAATPPVEDPDAATPPTPDPDAAVEDPDEGVVEDPDGGGLPPIEVPPEEPPPPPAANAGWIGGPCDADEDCEYAEGFCLRAREGWPHGTCSLGCDRFCPDADGQPVTFCVDDVVVGQGACVQRCDPDAFPGNGCRPGYVCRAEGRYMEPDRRESVCLPGEEPPPPPDDPPPPVDDRPCLERLAALGVDFELAQSPNDHPAGHPEMTCRIRDAVRVSSPIAGVDHRYFEHDDARPMLMACELAVRLHEFAGVLRAYGIREVVHMGTYNCRIIGGLEPPTLSEHAKGTAFDYARFVHDDGHVTSVLDDWESDPDNLRTADGRLLWQLLVEMWEREIFNIILTPNYNDAHADHLHCDLTPGVRGIGI